MTLSDLKVIAARRSMETWSVCVTSDGAGCFEYAIGPMHDQRNGRNSQAILDARFIAMCSANIDKLIAVAEMAEELVNKLQSENWVNGTTRPLTKALAALESE